MSPPIEAEFVAPGNLNRRKEEIMSLVTISIVGNLVKDPESMEFVSGRIKTTLVLAVNGFNKVRKEKTCDFFKVETWDKLAQLSSQYLAKGSQVAVSGRFSLEHWLDKEGKERITPVVHVSQMALPPKSSRRADNDLRDLSSCEEDFELTTNKGGKI
jgi:single-strand DNA-binding protein